MTKFMKVLRNFTIWKSDTCYLRSALRQICLCFTSEFDLHLKIFSWCKLFSVAASCNFAWNMTVIFKYFNAICDKLFSILSKIQMDLEVKYLINDLVGTNYNNSTEK